MLELEIAGDVRARGDLCVEVAGLRFRGRLVAMSVLEILVDENAGEFFCAADIEVGDISEPMLVGKGIGKIFVVWELGTEECFEVSAFGSEEW